MRKHRSKMKCEPCGGRPTWYITCNHEGTPTLQCSLCGRFQNPGLTNPPAAKLQAA